jgi:hypothetical protein
MKVLVATRVVLLLCCCCGNTSGSAPCGTLYIMSNMRLKAAAAAAAAVDGYEGRMTAKCTNTFVDTHLHPQAVRRA